MKIVKLLMMLTILTGCGGLPSGPYVPMPQISPRIPMATMTSTNDALRCFGRVINSRSKTTVLFLIGRVTDSTIPQAATGGGSLSSQAGRAFVINALSNISAGSHIKVMDLQPEVFIIEAKNRGPEWITSIGVNRVYTLAGAYTEDDRVFSSGYAAGAQYDGQKIGGLGSGDTSSMIERIGIDLMLVDTLSSQVLTSVSARIESYKDTKSFKLSLAGEEWGIGAGFSSSISDGLHAQQRVVTEFATLALLGRVFGVSVNGCLQDGSATAAPIYPPLKRYIYPEYTGQYYNYNKYIQNPQPYSGW